MKTFLANAFAVVRLIQYKSQACMPQHNLMANLI
jgi:hypothetical protein